MSYSFTKSIFQKWNVKTTPIRLETPDIAYHQVFLPNAAMEFLDGHIGRDAPVNGLIQQWSVTMDDGDGVLDNIVQEPQSGQMMNMPPHFFMVDSSAPLEPFPTTEALISANVGVLRYGRYDAIAEFPLVTGRKMFSMPPISPGIAFSSGKFKDGGFYALVKCSHAEPLDLEVTMRGQLFVHNN